MEQINLIDQVQHEMREFDQGCPERIQHFTKVHSFAAQIGRAEHLDEETQLILELTAVLHDIGIGPAEEKFGTCNGKMQEEMGPPYARKILEKYKLSSKIVDRVCFLIANHHSYENVLGLDYRILLEADFLVNLYENSVQKDGITAAYEKIFKTDTGKKICATMFDICP